MPLEIVYRRDITKIRCDAIVNAANKTLLGGGGVDGAIHAAAGPGLLEECRKLGGCVTGGAKLTGAYDLPCRYVIHTVGPVWQGGHSGEEELLRSCYRRSLALASENGCETVAFPVISAGVFGYPRTEALAVAVEEIARFLETSDMSVILSVYFLVSEAIKRELYLTLAERTGSAALPAGSGFASFSSAPAPQAKSKRRLPFPGRKVYYAEVSACVDESGAQSLEERLKTLDESFAQMLFRKIDEVGITDAECYRRANVDRRLFSKIRCDEYYRPSKATALAFSIALRLSLDETREMLMKAGYALSPSSRSDIIVQYFIERGEYDIFKINEALFAFDQALLGA